MNANEAYSVRFFRCYSYSALNNEDAYNFDITASRLTRCQSTGTNGVSALRNDVRTVFLPLDSDTHVSITNGFTAVHRVRLEMI